MTPLHSRRSAQHGLGASETLYMVMYLDFRFRKFWWRPKVNLTDTKGGE